MISINTNASSSLASLNLQKSSDLLQRSLARLSSGTRIATPSDDAGGLAVSMKLSAAVKRTQSLASNVSNALSLLQVQAGSLKTAGTVLDRISELATLANDPTKSAADAANYSTEWAGLTSELDTLANESFNGIALFASGAFTPGTLPGGLTVQLSPDGNSSLNVPVDQALLWGAVSNATSGAWASASLVSNITSAIQNIATLMANNGAQSNRLQYALDSLNIDAINLEAANSRIYDVDVAAETSKLARANILVQSGAAMLTQANASQSIALKLLQ